MNTEKDSKLSEKKKLLRITLFSVLALGLITSAGMFVLSKVKNSEPSLSGPTQEQFVGQAETSQQLQSECQNSAFQISNSDNLKLSVDEYKKRVENCKEVYFVIDEKTKFRNEGMYPDLAIDLLAFLYEDNKANALEFLNYLKTISDWQFYMGPIVCDSKKVIAAYEEAVKSTAEKICLKSSDFNEKIFSELKNKNFSVLENTMVGATVAWLGSPEANAGCPEKISSIIKTAGQVAGATTEIKEVDNVTETKEIGVAFRNKADEDKLVLEFGEVNGCFQLKAALVSGLEANE